MDTGTVLAQEAKLLLHVRAVCWAWLKGSKGAML